MVLENCLKYYTNRSISLIDNCTNYNISYSNLQFNENNLFNKFLIVNIKDEYIDIPLIAKNAIENSIKKNVKCNETSKFVIPLYHYNNIEQKVNTFSKLIEYAFAISYKDRLIKIIYKDNIYYGGRGIILDNKFNILMILTLEARIINDESYNTINYINPIIYINKIVFDDLKNLVYKNIIKRIIPYYINNNFEYVSSYSGIDYNNIIGRTWNIVIKDLSNFIYTPKKPKANIDMNNLLNNCLVDNINKLESI